jgi:predicted nucleotidyltransferase
MAGFRQPVQSSRMAAASGVLRELAQRVADDLPPSIAEEVVLTGSVSRGVADEFSDIEMLVVTREVLSLDDCFALARDAGLADLDTWGAPHPAARRVSGTRDAVPIELIWWPRDHAEARVDALFAGEVTSTADALAHGVALRTAGLLAAWQERLRAYPPELAAAQIENAALPWGGFAPAGLLTLTRAGDRLALVEWILDAAQRVLTIAYALNRVWPPTAKRLAVRTEALEVKPDRVAGRIEEALTDPDPERALVVITELQLETLLLAPSGPYVHRARIWLTRALHVLRSSRPPAA